MPITDILAFGKSPKHSVKFANNSYTAFILGDIIISTKHKIAKNGHIFLYLLA